MPRAQRPDLFADRFDPLHQGELDGLCGVYAVINAARLLCPELTRRKCDVLFEILLDALSAESQDTTNFVTNGIGPTTLRGLIELICDEIFGRWKVSLHCSAFPPKGRTRLDALWDEIHRRTSEGQVIVIGLSGHEDHWTVAFRTTPRRITLSDSSMMRFLNRAFCTTSRSAPGYRLCPREMFSLARL